jgi:hypothetical protein
MKLSVAMIWMILIKKTVVHYNNGLGDAELVFIEETPWNRRMAASTVIESSIFIDYLPVC